MKILLDPVYTLKKISGCSNYYKYKKVVLALLKNFSNVFIYFIVPDGAWERDDLIKDARVKNIPVYKSRIRWNEYYKIPDKFFEKFGFIGEYGDWDILITGRVPMVSNMKMCGYFTSRTPDRFVAILDDLPIMSFKKALQLFKPTLQQRMQIQGYLNSDMAFVFADFERRKIIEESKKYISFAEVKKLHDIMQTGYFILPTDKKIVKKNEKEFKVVYIQRTDKTERRPEEAWDAMKYFYITNNKTKNIVCDIYTNSMSGVPQRKDLTFLNFYRLDRNSYYEKLKTSNVFVSFSIDEGFPLAVYEAIMMGSLGIVYKADWSVDLLGKDYPFFFKTDAESVYLMKRVFENWDEEYKKFLKWREKLDYSNKKYYIDVLMDGIRKYWNACQNFKKLPPNNMATELSEAYKKGEFVDLNKDDLKIKIRKGIFADDTSYRGAFNDYMHTRHNLLFRHGWKDRLNRGEFDV